MVYINLLPIREIKRRTKAVQQITLFAFCFVAVLVLVGAVGFFQKTAANRLSQEITSLQAEKQRYNKILAQIKKFEADKVLIENKIAVINQLKKSSALTVHVLDEIANLTPTRRLWLTTINQSGSTLKLDGMALDNQTIASYMDKLKASPYVQNVTLLNSAQQTFAGRDLKSFQLTCSVAVPETTTETSQ